MSEADDVLFHITDTKKIFAKEILSRIAKDAKDIIRSRSPNQNGTTTTMRL